MFSIGAVAGIVFGTIYLALPNITGAIFSSPVRLLPLPLKDLTPYTEKILPAMPMMISFDLVLVVTGMVLPFWAMVGSFIGLIFTMVVNPVFHHVGMLDGWQPGIGGIQTIQSSIMDFCFSFSLGLGLAVVVIGFIHVFSSLRNKSRDMDENGRTRVDFRRLFTGSKARGDIPIWLAIGIYVFSTCAYIGVGYFLVNYCSGTLAGSKVPLWFLAFYGFVYTPIISYVNTRMEGIVGMQAPVPFVRQATFILSNYKGTAI